MFPDLVLTHRKSGKVVLFDAKYKKMEMRNKDVDRADLHQIHSYSGYYRKDLIACGLIYPLSKEVNTTKAHSAYIYGNRENDIKFIVDGIYVFEMCFCHTNQQKGTCSKQKRLTSPNLSGTHQG